MTKRRAIAFALTLPLAGVGLVRAADEGPHDGAIKARQSTMSLVGWNIGPLGAMAKEKMPYDAERAAEAAATLETVAHLPQTGYWPEGSDSESAGNAENRALPAIWEDRADFDQKMEDMRQASAALASVAGDGLGALQDGIGDLGSSCKACHDDYRAEKD